MADRIKNYQQEADQITTLKAIRTDLGVAPSSYTPDATVVTKDRVVTFAQAEEELAVLGDIEKGVKQQVTEVDIAQKDIANIKALLQGHLYDYQTDSTSAHIKSVPSGAMPYAGLEQIGGKMIVMNQLEPNPTTVYTSNGSHPLNEGTKFYAGHIYYMRCDYTGTAGQYTGASVYAKINGANRTIISATTGNGFHGAWESQFSAESDGTLSGNEGNCWVYVYLDGADSVTNIQIVDLTLMFGAGNEPSTPTDYEAIFPSIYAYNAGTLLSAGVTSVKSKDENNATLQTYSIPASIQALEGYGWSAGTAYNYVDFERKVFVQNVGRVDLGTLSWTSSTSYTNPFFYTSLSNRKTGRNDNFITAMYSNDYEHYTSNSFGDNANNMSIALGGLSGNNQVFVRNDSYTDAPSFKTAMDGVYLYYELATPIETDISEYLTDDNLIEVEAGGTLTFENQHGTDYQIPVPSEETYMIDLQEALS